MSSVRLMDIKIYKDISASRQKNLQSKQVRDNACNYKGDLQKKLV